MKLKFREIKRLTSSAISNNLNDFNDKNYEMINKKNF